MSHALGDGEICEGCTPWIRKMGPIILIGPTIKLN